jgi:hypothetical protein
VDLVVGVKGVEVLGLVKIPEHGGTVLATGGTQRTVGGDGDSVNVASVTDVVSLELAGGELPNLFSSSELIRYKRTKKCVKK